ncbi:ras-associated and pleckstrin homology domains-containing protein 1 [Phoenix dactylifera]|uniref:Ras-associated and pleckstrin homology domains-containing protein 1 n=1 Tax=Phoenix dactylifera TaxID=42345 RepID=A0A8B7CK54_PHODC|nr:ras-associated and pleckstrin homology domains-containing protein 1 [Phoenix dactylifera]
MGQALRRVTGRVRPSRPDHPARPPVKNPERPPPSPSRPDHPARPPVKNPERPPPPPPSAAQVKPPDSPTVGQDRLGISDAEVTSKDKDYQGVLEERDPTYDEMLKQMVGRITSRPGGKLEMGEAFVVERYNRPMPKLRSSKAEAGGSVQKPLPPGTLTIEQVRQIILLHQGKSDEHQGPMDINDIASKFRVDGTHVQRIVQFMSLPPEDGNGKSEQ